MDRGTQQRDDTGNQPVDRVGRALDLLEHGLAELTRAVDDGDLGSLDPAGLVELLQRWERFRNRMPVVDHAALAQAETRGTAHELGQPTTARVLVAALRVSSAEANRRVRAAQALGPRLATTGEQLAPVRPVLAAAQRTGAVTSEQVQVITRALSQVDRPGFDPADVDAGEELLTGYAESFEPQTLSRLAVQVLDAINPDGTLPDDQLVADRRHLSMRQLRDGGWVGEFRLTGAAGAKLATVLRPLAKPRVEQIPDPDGQPATAVPSGVQDRRTYGQRLHDALEDVCDQMLRSGTLPDSGGVPATVIVTITEESLRDRVGVGHTDDGAVLSLAQVLDLAEEAEVIPTVLTGAGAVEAQGRNRRIATAAQTWALVARDGGCSFPGCDRPPELCERHHVVPWMDGGHTDVDNLTLLCRWHHHQFEQRGWAVTMTRDRLPAWTPPRWIDRQQRPLLHDRIRQGQLARALSAARSGRAEHDSAREVVW